jgi:hypothetical protein
VSELGQKPGIWAILTLAWILYMERYLGFWGYVKIGQKLNFRIIFPQNLILRVVF